MFNRMRKTISKAINPRIITLLVVFILLTALLVQRLFQLQIVDGESYQNDHSLSIIRERTLASSRGNIYDRNGEPIAYNELSQCVTFENNGTYSSTKEQNLTINGILYNVIKIIEEQGDSIVDDFEVTLNEDGSYSYNVSGFTQQRFLADLFGEASISSLSDEQLNISADELMDMLCGSDYYGILDPSVTAQEKAEYGLPESFTDLEVYQLVSFGRKSPPTASSAIRPSPSPETSAMRPWPGFSKTRRIFRESISQRSISASTRMRNIWRR